jgi:predicted enzyme related to lactoylglutathione lyase
MANGLFRRLVYVYIGTSDYEKDFHFYKEILQAKLVWQFAKYGAKVAAFSLGSEPYLLIADHVHAPGKRLIYEVENIKDAANELKERGWQPDGEIFEVPDGPCINFKDKSGNEYAILQMTRPFLLDKEFHEK